MPHFKHSSNAAKLRGVALQLVGNPQQKHIRDATKALIDGLLLERLSMTGIGYLVLGMI